MTRPDALAGTADLDLEVILRLPDGRTETYPVAMVVDFDDDQPAGLRLAIHALEAVEMALGDALAEEDEDELAGAVVIGLRLVE